MYQYLLCVNGNTEYSDSMIELSHIDVLQVMKTQRINWAVFLRERMREIYKRTSAVSSYRGA